MQDPAQTEPLPAAQRPRSGRGVLVMSLVLLAFLLGAGLAGWLDSKMDLRQLIWPGHAVRSEQASTQPRGDSVTLPAPAPSAAPLPQVLPGPSVAGVETRLALLEDRMSRLTLQAEAASGNAARAESLLIAFAARRTIDRGQPLGYLEDQLKLRFADAQPNAVRTIIDAAAYPVTLEQLFTQLQAAGPRLAEKAQEEDAWTRIKREFADLFVIRKEVAPATSAEDRVERAKLLLASGNIPAAIGEVQRLPGAASAREWVAAARRYDDAHRALDLLETAAMLEPRKLNDAAGARVEQPSPIAPAAEASAAPAI